MTYVTASRWFSPDIGEWVTRVTATNDHSPDACLRGQTRQLRNARTPDVIMDDESESTNDQCPTDGDSFAVGVELAKI